jgi:hypothetical protein
VVPNRRRGILKKSEELIRAKIGTGLIQINATVLELFDIAKWCINVIEEEDLEGFDLDALRKAGASLLDCIEQILGLGRRAGRTASAEAGS